MLPLRIDFLKEDTCLLPEMEERCFEPDKGFADWGTSGADECTFGSDEIYYCFSISKFYQERSFVNTPRGANPL